MLEHGTYRLVMAAATCQAPSWKIYMDPCLYVTKIKRFTHGNTLKMNQK